MSENEKVNYARIYKFTATTTAVLFLRRNLKRKLLYVNNQGANIVELIRQGQAYGDGLPIAGSGGTFSLDHFNAQDEWWIISTTGDSIVRVLEVIQS